MKRVPWAVAVAVAVGLLAMAGCTKREQPEPLLPPPSVTTLPSRQPLPALPAQAATDVTAGAPVSAEETNQESGDGETQAELVAQVKQLENEYENATDFQKRVTLIYEISANDDGPAVIDTLAHLFLNEKDQELKVEMVNSLSDVDGQNDKKLAILSTALQADQPKDVRLEAIDGMGDAQDKRGIQILQGYLNDPDEEVKESAQDTIEQLQSVPETPPQPAQAQTMGH